MSQDALQEAARRQPFEPFRLRLTTGEAFEVRHPDLIMVGKRSAVIGLTNESTGTAYDRTIKVDLLHVASIEGLTKSPPSNGLS